MAMVVTVAHRRARVRQRQPAAGPAQQPGSTSRCSPVRSCCCPARTCSGTSGGSTSVGPTSRSPTPSRAGRPTPLASSQQHWQPVAWLGVAVVAAGVAGALWQQSRRRRVRGYTRRVNRPFAELLALPGVEEVCELRGRFGFMAFHGGSLEAMTDRIASEAAERSGASYYGVHQPKGLRVAHPVDEGRRPTCSPALAELRRPRRRRDHRPRVRPPGVLHDAAARRAEPAARRPRRRRAARHGCPRTRSPPTSSGSRPSCAGCTPATP